ncbi:hypothetical protein HK102_003282 [Quaeritorhiza haematococci]|nr:hypothetical protein HK102_003282 [Quaeritorhiza haematococci]
MTTSSTPKTFSNQSILPRLPIPNLEETANRYLRSVKPLLTAEAYAETERKVKDFVRPGGLGEELQKRLIEHDKNEPENWLDSWWLKLAYHTWREPVLVHSNWYMTFKDHPKAAEMLHTEEVKEGNFTALQVRRAAELINNLVNYKEAIDEEKIPPEVSKAGPFCMNQYRLVFGITRVPKAGCDVNVGKHPHPGKHITVSVRDQIYEVPVYGVGGERLPVDQIENPVNQTSFRSIEGGLFVVSLDDWVVPPTMDALGKNIFSSQGGKNRWLDKAISVIVQNDGRAGCNGEHSPCDALIPAFICDHAVAHEPAMDPPTANANAVVNPPKKLTWKVDDVVRNALKDAERNVQKNIEDSDVKVVQFNDYGADFMKSKAKVSPDAYVQMALQATYYRIHKKFAPVYETASTRLFLLGRTETTRSLSLEQVAFVKAFHNPTVVPEEKFKLLQQACKAHIEYITAASRGKGVDRHMLGLRMCLKPGERHEIFEDPVFKESTTFRLSTSGLFPSKNITATGFGAVVPDGYGMNYQITPKNIKLGVESKISCKETSSPVWCETLTEVLRDMAKVVEGSFKSHM